MLLLGVCFVVGVVESGGAFCDAVGTQPSDTFEPHKAFSPAPLMQRTYNAQSITHIQSADQDSRAPSTPHRRDRSLCHSPSVCSIARTHRALPGASTIDWSDCWSKPLHPLRVSEAFTGPHTACRRCCVDNKGDAAASTPV